MEMSRASKGILLVGSIIRNVVSGKDNFLEVNPDIESSGKITKLLSSFTYTPNIVVDESLRYMDEGKFRDIVKTELLAFSGVLLQAFRVLSEIYSDAPNIIVNKMANHGNIRYGDLSNVANYFGNESFDYTADLFKGDGPLPITIGNEAPGSRGNEIKNNNSIQKDTSVFLTTYEVQISVTTNSGDERVIVLPVVIYPNIIFTNATSFISNMVESNHGKGLFERIDDYRAGVISFSDLIFATDLVKEYKDKKIKNENDFAKYLNKVDKITGVKDLVYGHNSFHKNFNIYIFDINKKRDIETKLRGSVLVDKHKNKLTDTLAAFSVSFVDTEAEELIILLDSIPNFSVLNFNMLKKEKDNDIRDVIKELMKNRQPF